MNIKTDLIALNEKSLPMEQAGGPEAVAFFDALLSSELIFQRTNGDVVDKGVAEGFMENIKNNPFEKRVLERDSWRVGIASKHWLFNRVFWLSRERGTV